MLSVRAPGPVAAVIMALRAMSRPSCGRFFGGVSAKVRIRAAWSTDMTPVLTASAMSGKFFNPRARATILFALLGVRRVVEVSHPAGPGKPSFSRLTRVSMSATNAIRRASNSWILWETSAASARSSLSLSCQISVVMDQVYRTGVRCAMMVQSKTIAVHKDSGCGTCRWPVIWPQRQSSEDRPGPLNSNGAARSGFDVGVGLQCTRCRADLYCWRVFRNHHSPAMGSTTGMKT